MTLYVRVRNLHLEEMSKKSEALEQERTQNDGMLGDLVDKDDIIRRISEHTQQDSFVDMFSMFYCAITKQNEDTGVLFQCKTVEGDLFVDFVRAIPAKDATSYDAVNQYAELYQGPESFMLEDNYRTGLHEFVEAYGIDLKFCMAVEYLSVGFQAKQERKVVQSISEFSSKYKQAS